MAFVASLEQYRRKLRERGVSEIVAGRLRWYRQAFQMNNWLIGRLIELCGNQVTVDGIRLSLDNPLITTRHKSTIYFGIYEIGERELSKQFIDPTLPTIEIGGSIGVVACSTNRLLADPTAHVVVECNPLVLPTLEKNRALNGCRFTIEPRALAYDVDTISFTIAPDHFMMGRLGGSNGQEVIVRTVTLAEIIATHQFKTVNLISDSEGAEVEHEADLLRRHVKIIILETHEA
jgi:FkbM family methyltransferase